MQVHRIDHVGVIVNDLPAAKAFFLDFGLELQGEGALEGAWLDRVAPQGTVVRRHRPPPAASGGVGPAV